MQKTLYVDSCIGFSYMAYTLHDKQVHLSQCRFSLVAKSLLRSKEGQPKQLSADTACYKVLNNNEAL